MKEHETRSYLTVCGGDFDGDGKDEAAVYVPVTDARNGVNASHVDIYDINTESSTKTFEKRSTVYLADLEGTQPGKTLDDSKLLLLQVWQSMILTGMERKSLQRLLVMLIFRMPDLFPQMLKRRKSGRKWDRICQYCP